MRDQSARDSDHRLVHGDAFELLADLETDSAHCAIVDYPWEFDAENGMGYYDDGDLYETENSKRIREVFDELERVLVDGSWIFVFADDEIVPTFRSHLVDSGLNRRQTCVWDRKAYSMGYYHRVQHYPILTATNGDTDRKLTDRGTVYEAVKTQGGIQIGSEYSTGKPIELYRKILEPPVLEAGEWLLEPFAGHAPGLRVCQERGLGYWGAEISRDLVDDALDRPEPRGIQSWGGADV